MNPSAAAALDSPVTSGVGVNEAFLREVLAWIEIHQERWNQSAWGQLTACGTTYCLAGWAYVLTTGDEFGLDRRGRATALGDVFDVATRALGLTGGQAHVLFYFTHVHEPGSENNGLGTIRPPTFADLCAKVEEVTGVRFKPLPECLDDLEPA